MNSRNSRPRIAITVGEPAGIGADLCALLNPNDFDADLLVLGDADVLQARAKQLNHTLELNRVNCDVPSEYFNSPSTSHAQSLKPPYFSNTALNVWHQPCPSTVNAGQLNTENAAYVITRLKHATDGCLSKQFDALVTAPMHKGVVNDAGIPFTGHTEQLGDWCKAATGQGEPVMMLTCPTLRVALVTTHLPLKEVSAALTRDNVAQTLRILHHDLIHRFGIVQPNILVCGLNPHAGESGHMGREEIDVIEPTLNLLRAEGMHLSGPLPADTAFTHKHLEHADAVLSMFHDQGLPVLKYAGFGQSVNVTLGLPMIRTSVDHGTALDLAGKGNIDHGSFHAAINEAIRMANHQNHAIHSAEPNQ